MASPKRRTSTENAHDLCVGITVSLKMSQISRLTAVAKKRGLTRSALASTLIENGLAKLEDK